MGSLLGTTVNFNGTAATIIASSATQLVVSVPAGATTGAINITNTTTGCSTATPTFTIINKDMASCQGASAVTDLIIYDIHDEKTGSGGFITLYNGTAATVNLTNYTLWRTSNHDDGNEIDYANLTGTIAPGALGILKVSVGSCGPASTNGTIDGGFNENDGIQLRNAAGTVVIDDVDTYPTVPGYYMVRNTGALSARTSYVAADWSTTPLLAGECYPSAGLTIPSAGTPPTVSVQPTVALTCASTTASMSVSATEGFVGGNALAYQWYAVAPNTTTWTALTNTGVYTGATSATLNISSLVGLDGYQYYCQVMENTASCYIATVAVKISTGATVWNGSTWSNGIPTLSKAATINGNYSTATNGSFSACNVTVNATFTLTISANTYVEIQNNVTNNGTLTIDNTGSLVQINDLGVNTGSITMKRTANQRFSDYVYWSSPVANFGLNYFTATGGTPSNYILQWGATAPNPNGGEGFWSTASGNMSAGKGYIVRGSSSFTDSAPTSWEASFTGVPNNGVVTVPIQRGNDYTGTGTQGIVRTANDDNWNLVGNPYPSAIGVNEFLNSNSSIDGFVKIWTHGNLPTSITDPFYQNFVWNYFATDYTTVNSTGVTSGPGDYKIGAGQGFFVSMTTGLPGSSTVTFHNAMRSRDFANNQFYKSANNNGNSLRVAPIVEKNRIWLDLVGPTQKTTRTLVGYVDGATNQRDRLFDAITDYKNSQNFYSILDTEIMAIQGKAVPFDVNDQISLGIKIPTEGTYTIAIAAVDGLFSNSGQKIFLEDKLLQTIHEIGVIPYQFTASQGVVNDRFVLRYTNTTLSTNDVTTNNNSVIIYTSDNAIKVVSTLQHVKNITVYNVLGQNLASKITDQKEVEINTIQKSNQALVVKITLENDAVVTKKLIH